MNGNRENWFLCDPADKDEIDKLYRRSAKIYIASFLIALAAGGVCAISLEKYLGENTLWISIAAGIALFGIWVAYAIYADRRRKDILRANEAKFKDNRLDEVRRQLQSEYCAYHRRGNMAAIAVFFGFCAAGLIAGACTADYSKSGWSAHIGGVTGFAAFAGMVVALAVLFIMLARYVKRIKPAEQYVYEQLTKIYEQSDGDSQSNDEA